MPNNDFRHTTARLRGCIQIHTKAPSNLADISRQILRRLRHIRLRSKGVYGYPAWAGYGSRPGVFKVRKVTTCLFESTRCPMQTPRNTASSKHRAVRRKSPMYRRHILNRVMTIPTSRFEFHLSGPTLMFQLPLTFQPDENPALVEARIKARRWMRERGMCQSCACPQFVVAGKHDTR